MRDLLEHEDPVWWCDECEAYECGWCGDFNAETPWEVKTHAAKCSDRPRPTASSEVPKQEVTP